VEHQLVAESHLLGCCPADEALDHDVVHRSITLVDDVNDVAPADRGTTIG
jgi:hypothetical protein